MEFLDSLVLQNGVDLNASFSFIQFVVAEFITVCLWTKIYDDLS